jgi:hypothetical protein
MIDMRMGKNDRIDCRWREWEGPVVELLLGFGALKHTAIDQNPGILCFQSKAGSCDGSRRSMKMEPDRLTLRNVWFSHNAAFPSPLKRRPYAASHCLERFKTKKRPTCESHKPSRVNVKLEGDI